MITFFYLLFVLLGAAAFAWPALIIVLVIDLFVLS